MPALCQTLTQFRHSRRQSTTVVSSRTLTDVAPSCRLRLPRTADQAWSFLAHPDRHRDLVQRVAGPHENRDVELGAAGTLTGAEGDPATEHVPLRRHEREREVVGVQDENAGSELHTGRRSYSDRRHFGRDDRADRAEEMIALRPERAEARLPLPAAPSPAGCGRSPVQPDPSRGEQELDAYTSRLRSELTPEDVAADLLAVVGRTVEPRSAAVWLPPR